ncbi:hypothetical protein, partial [Candidatus Binatus sp.]
REMRDKIREAARDVRNRAHDQPGSTTQSNTQATTQSNTEKTENAEKSRAEKFRPGGTVKLNRDDAILEILAAVKDGRLEPDEADDLINAWMEVSRTDEIRH